MTTTRRLIGGTAQRLARGTKRLPAVKKRGAIVSKAGRGKPGPTTAAAGSGIASPLTEVAKTRTFYSQIRELKSTDGLFTLEYRNPLQLTWRDAVAREVKMILDDPDSWAP